MHRTALARTHRPRRFEQLVGQDHVASTLRAAVEGGRAAHAYLFCGPRGIGKTTAARVLAMALNCPNREAGEPCGTCESCERIWSGRTSLDVVEIDAATNRGVDDARDLRERAMYAPSDEERFKVYILDEAHMLTREAWNALLKVLEEPPPRVIFVFATTEPQKIQQTAEPVLSRCQRFNFRRVSVPDLLERLGQVLELEGATAEEGALLSIARRAEGGVRDALSLLDQVLSFTDGRIAAEDVRRMLGLVDEERYLELFGIVAGGERGAVFPFVQALVDDGYDLAEFVRGLGEALRLLLALRLDPAAAVVELTEDSRRRFHDAAGAFDPGHILRLLTAVSDFEAAGRLRRSTLPRVQVEVLLLRLVCMDSSATLEELLAAAESGRGPAAADPADSPRRSPRSSAAPASDAGPSAAPRDGASPARADGASPARADGASPARRDGASPARAGGHSAAVRSAWRQALASASGMGGQAVVLNAARIDGLHGDVLRIQVPPGLAPDIQALLDDPRRSAPLRSGLAGRLGVAAGALTFRVEEEGRGGRVTADAAREQRLARMVEVDPRLAKAVSTLDLKLEE